VWSKDALCTDKPSHSISVCVVCFIVLLLLLLQLLVMVMRSCACGITWPSATAAACVSVLRAALPVELHQSCVVAALAGEIARN